MITYIDLTMGVYPLKLRWHILTVNAPAFAFITSLPSLNGLTHFRSSKQRLAFSYSFGWLKLLYLNRSHRSVIVDASTLLRNFNKIEEYGRVCCISRSTYHLILVKPETFLFALLVTKKRPHSAGQIFAFLSRV